MTVAAMPPAAVKRTLSRDDILVGCALVAMVAFLLLVIAAPLGLLLSKSFQSGKGEFVGLANYAAYFSTPTLVASLWNSIWVALLTTAVVIPVSFGYAWEALGELIPDAVIGHFDELVPSATSILGASLGARRPR